jgi:hypothetical protein
VNDWELGWDPGQLAERLLLVGDDEALTWAVTEKQVRYVAQVYGWPEWRVRQIMRNRATWMRFFGRTQTTK